MPTAVAICEPWEGHDHSDVRRAFTRCGKRRFKQRDGIGAPRRGETLFTQRAHLRPAEEIHDVSVAELLVIDTSRTSQAPYAVLPQQDAEGHSDPVVAKAQSYMERHLHEPLSLGQLADQLAVSGRTLNRRFRSALGKAPLQYLQLLRIHVAKRLLESKRLSVDRVSERVGYTDTGAFRQLFKRETGLSPSEYRQRFARSTHSRTIPVNRRAAH